MDGFQVLALVNAAVILVVAVHVLLNDALVETFESVPGKSFLVIDKDGNIEHLSMEAMERAINSVYETITASSRAYDDEMRNKAFTSANFPKIHAKVSEDNTSATSTINTKMTNTVWSQKISEREDASVLSRSIQPGQETWVTVNGGDGKCLFNADEWKENDYPRKAKFEGGGKCERNGFRHSENSGMRIKFNHPAPYDD